MSKGCVERKKKSKVCDCECVCTTRESKKKNIMKWDSSVKGEQ